MKLLAITCMIIAIAFGAIPERADAQTACKSYRVKKGDTLRKISERAYGYENHKRIYKANRSRIGRNPNVIGVGVVLRLPCVPGTAKKAVPAAQPKVAPDAMISFVTADGFLPYTDESRGSGGLFTQLVTTAMVRSAPDKRVEVVFVNDWSAHLEELLPRQAFDASFPWTRPVCEAGKGLSATEQSACETLVFSDPFYEVVDGFFSLSGSGYETVVAYDGFADKTICRPEGYSTGHLEENGLTAPTVTLVQPDSAQECFRLLVGGKVDLVALDTRAGERAINALGLQGQLLENQHLFSIEPLQIAINKSNPRSAELIQDLNNGLKVMLESGEWDSIVTEGLRPDSMPLTN